MAFQSLLLLFASGAVLLLLLLQRMKKKRSPLPLPPGPPALPLIGNVLDVPTDGPMGFRDLCTKYGVSVRPWFVARALLTIRGRRRRASQCRWPTYDHPWFARSGVRPPREAIFELLRPGSFSHGRHVGPLLPFLFAHLA